MHSGTEWACRQLFLTHKEAKLEILTKIYANLSTKSQICQKFIIWLALAPSLFSYKNLVLSYCQKKLKPPFSCIIFFGPCSISPAPPLSYILNAALPEVGQWLIFVKIWPTNFKFLQDTLKKK